MPVVTHTLKLEKILIKLSKYMFDSKTTCMLVNTTAAGVSFTIIGCFVAHCMGFSSTKTYLTSSAIGALSGIGIGYSESQHSCPESGHTYKPDGSPFDPNGMSTNMFT